MSTTRLEAFSDGVIAILITIMVLELRVPHGTDWAALRPTVFTILMYVLSFVYLGIYWTNHHHMFHATKHVNGAVLWANLHLLFWLSLVPFITNWMGENHFASFPTSVYGFVLLMAAIAYVILQRSIIKQEGPRSILARAIGTGFKEKISPMLYFAGVVVAWVQPMISCALYVLVAIIWLVPDRRIEQALLQRNEAP